MLRRLLRALVLPLQLALVPCLGDPQRRHVLLAHPLQRTLYLLTRLRLCRGLLLRGGSSCRCLQVLCGPMLHLQQLSRQAGALCLQGLAALLRRIQHARQLRQLTLQPVLHRRQLGAPLGGGSCGPLRGLKISRHPQLPQLPLQPLMPPPLLLGSLRAQPLHRLLRRPGLGLGTAAADAHVECGAVQLA